jgi:hypothetical protein
MIRQNQVQSIENPRNHPNEAVTALQNLLKSGAPLRKDPRRPNMFEVDDEDCVFYIYVSPSTGTVTLLAAWALELEPEAVAG